MRSLSNLLKSDRVVWKQDTKRVIDTNALIADKLELLQKTLEEKQLQSGEEDDFVAGLKASQIELICKEQEEEKNKKTMEETLREAEEKAEGIVREANSEAAGIKERAYQEGADKGYAEGQKKAETELAGKLQELKKKEKQLEESYQQKLQEMEPLILNAVADVYQYVFSLETDKRKDILLHVIHNTVLKLEGSRTFIIRVSNEDYKYIKENKEKLMQKVSEMKSLEIIEDTSLSVSQCMIETDGGLYDCSIDVELDELTKAIKSLVYTQ